MLRTALRNVLAHKARLIMTVLAVLLGVAFVSGTLVFADTTANALRNAAAQSLKGVAVSVRAAEATATDPAAPDPAAPDPAGGEDGAPTTALDTALARKIRRLPGVASVRPTDGPLVITPAAPLASLAVGVVVTVLAAWLPSRRAARIAPVAALGSVDQAPPARALRVRNMLGTLLTGAGVSVMLYVSTLRTSNESNLMAAMLGGALTLGGVIVLAPLLSRPLITLAGKATTRLFGVAGKLARQNALRNPRRTAATASALMVGLALITGLTVGAHSAQHAMAAEATQGLTADYKVNYSTARGLDADAAGKVARVPGVAAAAPVTTAQLGTHGEYAVITGTDPEAFGRVARLDFRAGSLHDIGPGRIAVSDEFAERAGLRVGTTLDAEIGGGMGRDRAAKRKLTIVAIYARTRTVDEALGTRADVLPYSATKQFDNLLVKAEPGEAAGLERKIRAALGDSPLLKVRTQEQLVKDNNESVTTVLSMLYGLLGMAVVIAVLGVVNTLAMSVFERTREIGMLRAIGLDRSGVRQMVRLESVVISLFGAVLGIGTGIFLAWAAGGLTTSSMHEYTMVLPWGRLGTFLILALMIGALAAIWPARRAARLNMLRSIQPS
ncbi:ABC transporter permease [Streptomyces sp. NPDC048506]|uniref:ABC transporter permease n=1 Tax=Streptomyces sp. NPDC048506 TaxID=3155028 RepID=UPI00344A7238